MTWIDDDAPKTDIAVDTNFDGNVDVNGTLSVNGTATVIGILNAINTYITGSYRSGVQSITATPGGAFGGNYVSEQMCIVDTAATAGDSVSLPSAGNGLSYYFCVKNEAANSVNVMPTTGDKIDDGAVSAAYVLPVGAAQIFRTVNADAWVTVIDKVGILAGITAYSGGGNASATQVYTGKNVVGTVAADDDSVILPLATGAGLEVEILNDGANDLAIFPAAGEDLGNGADTAYYLHSGSTQRFLSTAASTWTYLNRGTRLVDRGDPASIDWIQTDLTVQDGTYTDLSLSAKIPKSAYGKPVELLLAVRNDGSGGSTLIIRKNGNSNPVNTIRVRSHPTDAAVFYMSGFAFCDSNGVVEYAISSTMDWCQLSVRSYSVEG